MGYNILDSLNTITGQPELDLPLDAGDGPFASPMPRRGEVFDTAAMGNSTVVDTPSRREQELIDSGRRLVSAGTIYVSDIIPAYSFRRVQHDVNINFASYEHMQSLDQSVVIRFQGAAGAVLAEKINSSRGNIPGANFPEIFLEMLDIANRAAASESTSADGRVDLRTPLPPSQSFYHINFRQPATEFLFGDMGVTYDPEQATGLDEANALHEFRFNVDSRETFELRYPIGRRVPIIFDIVNRGSRAVSADLYVEVLIRQ